MTPTQDGYPPGSVEYRREMTRRMLDRDPDAFLPPSPWIIWAKALGFIAFMYLVGASGL